MSLNAKYKVSIKGTPKDPTKTFHGIFGISPRKPKCSGHAFAAMLDQFIKGGFNRVTLIRGDTLDSDNYPGFTREEAFPLCRLATLKWFIVNAEALQTLLLSVTSKVEKDKVRQEWMSSIADLLVWLNRYPEIASQLGLDLSEDVTQAKLAQQLLQQDVESTLNINRINDEDCKEEFVSDSKVARFDAVLLPQDCIEAVGTLSRNASETEKPFAEQLKAKVDGIVDKFNGFKTERRCDFFTWDNVEARVVRAFAVDEIKRSPGNSDSTIQFNTVEELVFFLEGHDLQRFSRPDRKKVQKLLQRVIRLVTDGYDDSHWDEIDRLLQRVTWPGSEQEDLSESDSSSSLSDSENELPAEERRLLAHSRAVSRDLSEEQQLLSTKPMKEVYQVWSLDPKTLPMPMRILYLHRQLFRVVDNSIVETINDFVDRNQQQDLRRNADLYVSREYPTLRAFLLLLLEREQDLFTPGYIYPDDKKPQAMRVVDKKLSTDDLPEVGWHTVTFDPKKQKKKRPQKKDTLEPQPKASVERQQSNPMFTLAVTAGQPQSVEFNRGEQTLSDLVKLLLMQQLKQQQQDEELQKLREEKDRELQRLRQENEALKRGRTSSLSSSNSSRAASPRLEDSRGREDSLAESKLVQRSATPEGRRPVTSKQGTASAPSTPQKPQSRRGSDESSILIRSASCPANLSYLPKLADVSTALLFSGISNVSNTAAQDEIYEEKESEASEVRSSTPPQLTGTKTGTHG